MDFIILKLCPENAEDFVEYLLSVEHLDEAAVRLAQLVNNENFNSKKVLVCNISCLIGTDQELLLFNRANQITCYGQNFVN